jgi:pimeloyl-ACP methyl ester carboxylesterase
MTHEWEKPVKSILDYFSLKDVTLIGMSLGGYLSLRAAAYEKRVKRVIAYDILADFFDVLTHQIDPGFRDTFKDMINKGNKDEVNTVLKKLMEKSLMLEWGIMQGMHITGSKSPYEFLFRMLSYNTESFSHLITQDILLLAGQNDHYVPIKQFTDQILTLTNVHSLTARMFTSEETADNHCQIGNLGLAADVMLNWINQIH